MPELDQSWSHAYEPRSIWGQIGTDSQQRVDFDRLRRERLERLHQQMKTSNLEVLILFDGDNIRYATGLYDYGWRTYLRYCVVPTGRDPIVFDTVGVDIECTKANAPWMKGRLRPAIVWKNSGPAEGLMVARFADGVKACMKEVGVRSDQVGSDIPDASVVKALSEVGIQVVDGNQTLSNARSLKTRDELELLKLSCAFADNAFWLARNEWVKPGIRESQVKGMLARFLIGECACEFYVGNVSSGSNANPYYRGEHTDKVIRQGDIVIIDIVPKYQGYWADFVRCWVVEARPTAKMKEVYQLSHDSLQGAIKAARPGATTADVAKRLLADDVVGVREETEGSTGLLNAGHGVGLSSHEQPWITRAYSVQYPQPIKANMYFAIETYVRNPKGMEAARLEDNFVVTDNGPVVFSLFPFEEDLL